MSDAGDHPDALISTVVKRAGFLTALSSGPIPKRRLGDELDVSRSTVYKAVRELHEYELVERTEDGLALTLAGRILESEYGAFRTVADDVRRTRELPSILPADSKISTALIEDATVIFAERHAPNHPLQYFEELVENADRVRGISPVALPQYVELFHDRATTDGMTVELVLERPVVEYLVTDYSEQLDEALASEHVSIWELDDTLPFGLIVVEGGIDSVGVVVYDDRGELRGLITNDTPAAMAWGKDVFDSYHERSTLVGGRP
jgi:predicted transcriptional regulator